MLDEDILQVLGDGNDSDIDLFDDSDDEEPIFNPAVFDSLDDLDLPEDLADNQRDGTVEGSQAPSTPATALFSIETTVECPSHSGSRPRRWRVTSFEDMQHMYPDRPVKAVREPIEYVQEYFDDEFYEMVTEDDYICEACFHLAMQTVNAQLTDNSERDRCAGPSRRAHTEVCLVCGRSLANRQSHVILRDQDQAVIQIIQNRLSPRQVSQYDRSCHACWMSARREATRNQQVDEGRVDLPVNTDQNIPFEIQSVIDSVPSHHSRSQPGSPQPVVNEQPDVRNQNKDIVPDSPEPSTSRSSMFNNTQSDFYLNKTTGDDSTLKTMFENIASQKSKS
ncbi:hypothetical protein ACJJTC_016701 [Scirpophaga incertulas]